MCYELARVFDTVRSHGTIDSVVLSGGASQGKHFQACVSGLFVGVPVHQVEDAAWMGTRGVLHAFGSDVSQARVRPVGGGNIDTSALKQGYEIYLEAFSRLYGHVTAGHAYAVEQPTP